MKLPCGRMHLLAAVGVLAAVGGMLLLASRIDRTTAYAAESLANTNGEPSPSKCAALSCLAPSGLARWASNAAADVTALLTAHERALLVGR